MDIRTLGAKLRTLGGQVNILDDKTLISKEKEGYKLYRLLNTDDYQASEVYELITNISGTNFVRVTLGKNTGLLYKDLEVAVKPMYSSIKCYGGKFISLSDRSVTSIWVNRGKVLDNIIPAIYKGVFSIIKVNEDYYLIMLNKDYKCVLYKYSGNSCVKLPYDLYDVQNFIFGNLIVFNDSNGRLKLLNLNDNSLSDLDSFNGGNGYLDIRVKGKDYRITTPSDILTTI